MRWYQNLFSIMPGCKYSRSSGSDKHGRKSNLNLPCTARRNFDEDHNQYKDQPTGSHPHAAKNYRYDFIFHIGILALNSCPLPLATRHTRPELIYPIFSYIIAVRPFVSLSIFEVVHDGLPFPFRAAYNFMVLLAATVTIQLSGAVFCRRNEFVPVSTISRSLLVTAAESVELNSSQWIHQAVPAFPRI